MTTVNVSEIFSSIQGEGRFAGHPAIFIRFAGCSVGCGFCDTKHAQTCNPAYLQPKENMRLHSGQAQPEKWYQLTVQDVCTRVFELIEHSNTDKSKRIDLIVITGGEPFEQPVALLEICKALVDMAEPDDSASDGIAIHIETSGTVPLQTIGTKAQGTKPAYTLAAETLGYISNSPWCFLTVSPKYKPLHLEYVYAAGQLKFLVGHKPELDVTIPELVLKLAAERGEDVCFQPIWDDTDPAKTQMAIDRAIKAAYKYGGTVSTQVHKFLNIR